MYYNKQTRRGLTAPDIIGVSSGVPSLGMSVADPEVFKVVLYDAFLVVVKLSADCEREFDICDTHRHTHFGQNLLISRK